MRLGQGCLFPQCHKTLLQVEWLCHADDRATGVSPIPLAIIIILGRHDEI